jgi:UDP-N-acetylmuramoylalanine--D-glutamate ligase
VAKPLTMASLDSLTSWNSAWAQKRAVVVGLGQVGFAVADTLHELGVDVLVVSDEADLEVVNIAEVLGVATVIGDEAEQISAAIAHQPDFVVVSPGVRAKNGAVSALSEAGVPVWSDIDFAWRVRDKNDVVATWVLVQGGRVAKLATRLLQAESVSAHHVGFEATPLLDALRDPHPYKILIISVNPNAVHWWERFPTALRRPFLTLSMESPTTGGNGVFFDGTTFACVYRKGVGSTEALVEDADVVEGARAIGVGLDTPGMSDLGVVEGILCDRAFADDRVNEALEISTVEELGEAGWVIPDDLPLVLAATAIARSFQVPSAVIAGVLSLP